MASTTPNTELAIALIHLDLRVEKEHAFTDNQRPPRNDFGKSASISKLVPCFIGFGDAYDYVDCFKQICRSYEPIMESTKVTTVALMLND